MVLNTAATAMIPAAAGYEVEAGVPHVGGEQ